MFFKQITAVVLAGLIGAQSAAIITLPRDQPPQQEQESGPILVILDSEITPVGNLTIWGVPDNEDSATTTMGDFAHSDVHRRCGGNQVQCNSAHSAYTTVCSALIDSLRNVGVSTAPRSICLNQSGNQCCISWANPAPGLVQTELYNAANKERNNCGGGGSVSAIARDVNLHGVCTSQCLSNRPNGCT